MEQIQQWAEIHIQQIVVAPSLAGCSLVIVDMAFDLCLAHILQPEAPVGEGVDCREVYPSVAAPKEEGVERTSSKDLSHPAVLLSQLQQLLCFEPMPSCSVGY